MAMQPDQLASYNAWINAGARGSPPAGVFDNRAQLQQQEQQRQQALALAQQSGMSNAFDMQGTGYGGAFAPRPAVSQQVATPTQQPMQSVMNAPAQTSVAGPVMSASGPTQTLTAGGSSGTLTGLGDAVPINNSPDPNWAPPPNTPTIIGAPNGPSLPAGTTGGVTTIQPNGTQTTTPVYTPPTSNPTPAPTPTPTTGGGGAPATPTTGLPNPAPISWPTGTAGTGPTYAGNVRDIGGELGAISSYFSPFAQMGYNNALELNPQYTQLNLANYQTALGGVSGSMRDAFNQANPGLANYEGDLRQTLSNVTANTPTGVGASGYTAATASPTLAPNAAQAEFGGSAFGPTTISPNTGYAPVSAQASDFGLQTAASRLGGVGPSSIQQTLEGQASQGLALGRSLSDEDKRMGQQAAREAWSARGLVNSNGAIADEVLNRDAISRQRENERRGFAQSVDQQGFTQRQQGLGAALGLSNTAQGYAGLGLQAQQANLGAQLTGNALGFQGQLANQGNALNYAQLAQANSQYNAGQQNQMGQFGASLGQANEQFNAQSNNQANQFNTGAVNNMNQFNQNLALQGNQNAWNNAAQYGQFLQGNAFSPFAAAQAQVGQTPDYLPNLLGYGGDSFNTSYNAARAAEINAENVSAGKTAGWLGALGSLFQGLCFVAREVYGVESPRWKIFRSWMQTRAPKWFYELYAEHGADFAEFIHDKPKVKAMVRAWMDQRLEEYATGQPTAEDAFALTEQEVA
jgi:hypothetical protein